MFVKKSMKIFKSGDKPYLRWMKSNPNGFVINTASGDKTAYLMFHKADCHHISTYTKSQSSGAFTQKAYIKVCSLDSNELINWSISNRLRVQNHRICKTCNPQIEPFPQKLPEEIVLSANLIEGAARTITVNAYERNARAREECLKHYGYSCTACDFNFEKAYGKLCGKYIHVHHIIPLSKLKKSYKVDPIKDLRPVCPNCHAVIHFGNTTRSIEAVKRMLKKHNK